MCFLTSALGEGKWLALCISFLTTGEKNLRWPLKRRLDEYQNRSARFGEDTEIGNLTQFRSHLAHSIVTIPTELSGFLALTEPPFRTPPPPHLK